MPSASSSRPWATSAWGLLSFRGRTGMGSPEVGDAETRPLLTGNVSFLLFPSYHLGSNLSPMGQVAGYTARLQRRSWGQAWAYKGWSGVGCCLLVQSEKGVGPHCGPRGPQVAHFLFLRMSVATQCGCLPSADLLSVPLSVPLSGHSGWMRKKKAPAPPGH